MLLWIRFAKGTGANEDIEKLVIRCKNDFNSALNNDFNTPLALTIFYKLIKEVNSLAAEEKITETIAKLILPEFEKMMDVLGIQIIKVSDDEENEIKRMIKKRDECREQKNFEEADNIRMQIAKKNIVFADHKNRTIWIKQEKIKAE